MSSIEIDLEKGSVMIDPSTIDDIEYFDDSDDYSMFDRQEHQDRQDNQDRQDSIMSKRAIACFKSLKNYVSDRYLSMFTRTQSENEFYSIVYKYNS